MKAFLALCILLATTCAGACESLITLVHPITVMVDTQQTMRQLYPNGAFGKTTFDFHTTQIGCEINVSGAAVIHIAAEVAAGGQCVVDYVTRHEKQHVTIYQLAMGKTKDLLVGIIDNDDSMQTLMERIEAEAAPHNQQLDMFAVTENFYACGGKLREIAHNAK